MTPKLDYIKDETFRGYAQKYLNLGESTYDYAVGTFGSSQYFARK